jgi:hypothetical protein
MTSRRNKTRVRAGLAAWLAVEAAAASAAAASGATVALDRSCYTPGEPITQTGSGFTPGADVVEALTLRNPISGESSGPYYAPPVKADPHGAFTRRLRAPEMSDRETRREHAFGSFTDQADPQTNWSSVRWTLSAWDVEIARWTSGRAKLNGWMVVDTYGWTSAGTTLYAHYHRDKVPVARVRIGALRGACGDLRKRVRQFPFSGARPGRWTVFFSANRKLDRRKDRWISYTIRTAARWP